MSVSANIAVGKYAVRTFAYDARWSRLSSLTIRGGWDNGVCVATCASGEHSAPAPDCTCGVYSLLSLAELRIQYGDLAHKIVTVVRVEGAGYMGSKGLRTKAARVVAYWARLDEIARVARKQFVHATQFDDVFDMMAAYNISSAKLCVTCADEVGDERWEIGFRYCKKRDCVDINKKRHPIVQIAQHKAGPVVTTATPDVLDALSKGEFRDRGATLGRQHGSGLGKVKLQPRPAAKPVPAMSARIKYVQALQAQGFNPQQIVDKGKNIGLTRTEVLRYMSGKRV